MCVCVCDVCTYVCRCVSSPDTMWKCRTMWNATPEQTIHGMASQPLLCVSFWFLLQVASLYHVTSPTISMCVGGEGGEGITWWIPAFLLPLPLPLILPSRHLWLFLPISIHLVQWNLSVVVTHETSIFGHYRQVAAFKEVFLYRISAAGNSCLKPWPLWTGSTQCTHS